MDLLLKKEIIERIKNIKWFINCGKPLNIKTSFNIKYVKSWKEARVSFSDPIWENTTLKAGNELTSFLAKNYPDKYHQKWNELVRSAKSSIINELIPILEDYKKDNSLDKGFVDCVKWDVLGAVMEDIYIDYKKESILFLKLLEIYEAGNFPCGWIGTWPEGTLVVY